MSAHKAEVSTKIKDTQKSRFDVSMEKFFQLGLHRRHERREMQVLLVAKYMISEFVGLRMKEELLLVCLQPFFYQNACVF